MNRLLPLALVACAAPIVPFDPVAPPSQLAATGLVSFDGATLAYGDGVVPYRVATPLFSDFATKERAIVLPEGGVATYAGEGALDFPVGTLLLKTFLFPADARRPTEDLRLIETRVLARSEEGWEAWPYRWNDEGTDARLAPGGDVVDVHLVDRAGEAIDFAWIVPQRNQCGKCHDQLNQESGRDLRPLGPRPRMLHLPGEDGVDQLVALADAGVLAGLPADDGVTPATDWDEVLARGVDTLGQDEVDVVARDYLDANCAHCHNRGGVNGVTSQLFLAWDDTDAFHLGVCKRPGSAGKGGAGREFDIVPGDPEASILHFRMETLELGAMMPDLGRSAVDHDGVRVVERWIAGMTPDDCHAD